MRKSKFFNNKTYKNLWVIIFLISLSTAGFSGVKAKSDEGNNLLSYDELNRLYDQRIIFSPLEAKLKRLLTTAFVDNLNSNSDSHIFLETQELGKHIKVVHWNIERGLNYEAIEAIFTDMNRFNMMLDKEKFPEGSKERLQIYKEAAILQKADVIILNEVDWGIKRSGYRNITKDLAKSLRMNYAFGVQFVELSPIHISKATNKIETKEENEARNLIKVDSSKYKGLHGIAILSRFPLKNVRLVPFEHQPYDWYNSEKTGPGILEKGKRKIGEVVFLEESLREVRLGERTTLYADIAHEKFPKGRVTIAATHLENRSKPNGRVKQLGEILARIKETDHPVILAGDMNTSGRNLKPASIQRELTKRFGNPEFWIKGGIKYALGIGLYEDILMGTISFGRTQGDPTVKHIPYISPNPARKFFSTLEDFRFADGGAFDFRGDKGRSVNEQEKNLANSNQRADKGFVTTYQVKRPIKFIGKYKLDWIFVKPANLKKHNDKSGSYHFAPHFGQTLKLIYEANGDRISDHRPIVADLPLEEPYGDFIQ